MTSKTFLNLIKILEDDGVLKIKDAEFLKKVAAEMKKHEQRSL